jgi:methyl-accepting chemotaxis protein
MPSYVINAVETFKQDMEQISGVFDTLKGNSETGVYTAQGILALQEAGQARIRLKVKLLEVSLGELATLWFSRMRQFWKNDRWLRVTRADGSYDLKKFVSESLKYDYDIKITAGSTMPVNRGAMLDLMIRLAQTPMPDGQNLVDREAVVQYLPEEIKGAIIERMGKNKMIIEEQIQQLGQAVEQLTQQLQQIVQETQSNDEQTLGAVEEIASAIEHLNQQILQLKGSHDTLVKEKQEEEKLNKIKTESYNSGYTDAEKLFQDESGELIGEDSLPDDILQGLESLSDDELALIMKNNPELIELLNSQEQPLR